MQHNSDLYLRCWQSTPGRGFTLIELLIVIGLLAAMATYALTSLDGLSDRSRVDTTRHRMEQLSLAIAGDGVHVSRFISDMGRLCDVISDTPGEEFWELSEDARGVGIMEPYTYIPEIAGHDFSALIVDAGYGWNGPYLEMGGKTLFDGFGERFEIQTLTQPSWHSPSRAETGILAIRSLGRDGTEGPGTDWADADIESTRFDAMVSASLVIRVLVRGRAVVDDPAWIAPVIVSPVSSATSPGTYAMGDIFLSDARDTFRCKSNVTLASTGSVVWKTHYPGEVTTVTDGTNRVDWEYLGDEHEYMSEVKTVIFEPDTTGPLATVAEKTVRVTSGAAGTIILADLTGGIRWFMVYGALLDALRHSHGVILLSGPTGSGKTTTLYAALRHLKQPGTQHILSIEDPVEIPLVGINQVRIDSERVSFNKALRSTLRHDPDIIMIGEIRDAETADIAVKSALTGHLILSTLHANNSVGVVSRLLNLGISPELVTSSLRLVIAQRLVRRPCQHCVTWTPPSETDIEEFGWRGVKDPNIANINGCSLCGYTGYAGRLGLYEMIPVDREIRELVQSNASQDAIGTAVFRERRLPTLFQDGAEKVLQGLTTMDEVRRVTYLGEDS